MLNRLLPVPLENVFLDVNLGPRSTSSSSFFEFTPPSSSATTDECDSILVSSISGRAKCSSSSSPRHITNFHDGLHTTRLQTTVTVKEKFFHGKIWKGQRRTVQLNRMQKHNGDISGVPIWTSFLEQKEPTGADGRFATDTVYGGEYAFNTIPDGGNFNLEREALELDYAIREPRPSGMNYRSLFGNGTERAMGGKNDRALTKDYFAGSIDPKNEYTGSMREQYGPSVRQHLTGYGQRWPGGISVATMTGKKQPGGSMPDVRGYFESKARVAEQRVRNTKGNAGKLPQGQSLSIAQMMHGPLAPYQPTKAVREAFKTLSPAVLKDSAYAIKFYRQLALFTLGSLKDVLSFGSNLVSNVAAALPIARVLIQQVLKGIKEPAKTMKLLAKAIAGWKMLPEGLIGWPVYAMMMSRIQRFDFMHTFNATNSIKHGGAIYVDHKDPAIESTDIGRIDDSTEGWGCESVEDSIRNSIRPTLNIDPLAAHPEIKFRRPQNLIHVRLESIDPDVSDPPCKVYWDAIYNLKGQKILKRSEQPLGGLWPFFYRVCPSTLVPPRVYTQWIDYLPPKDRDLNPAGWKTQDLLCNKQECWVDEILHPVKEAGPPCVDLNNCPDCDLKKIVGGLGCDAGCRPGQKLWNKEHNYLSGECKVRFVQHQKNSLLRGWCGAGQQTKGRMRPFVLRVTNGTDDAVIGSMMLNYYDRASLENSFDYPDSGVKIA